MIYLFCHIVFASAFTLCLKWIQNRQREDIVVIGAINYITAAVLIFPEFYSTQQTINTPAVLTGFWMGACYFVAYFFVIFIIKWVGAASSIVVSSLSILLPIGVAAFLWNEIPNKFQLVGVVLAVISLSLIGTGRPKPVASPEATSIETAPLASYRLTLVVLIVFFLLAGSSRVAQRAFGHLSEEIHRPTFLFSAFAVAAVCSVVTLVVRRQRPTRNECLFGFALGTTNIVHSNCIMQALDRFPGYVVFPVASAGGLVLTTIVATQLLAERNSSRTLLGIGIAVIALVLLNW